MSDFGMPVGRPGPAGCPSAQIIARGGRLWTLIVLAVILAICAMPQLLDRAAAQTNDARLRTGGAVLQTGNADLLTSVTLVLHKSRNLRLDVPFAVVEVADPDIADARAISDRQIFILGKKIGATNVLLYGPSRQLIGVVDVEVKLDTRSLGSKIREGSGGKGIRVNDVYGKLVLSGNGGDSQTVERAMSVAAGLAPAGVVNALKVATPQQVMLKVRFVEADRAATRNLASAGTSSSTTATWPESSEPSRVAASLARCRGRSHTSRAGRPPPRRTRPRARSPRQPPGWGRFSTSLGVSEARAAPSRRSSPRSSTRVSAASMPCSARSRSRM